MIFQKNRKGFKAIRQNIDDAIDTIDAALYTGDAFLERENRDILREKIRVWKDHLNSCDAIDDFSKEPEGILLW